MIFVGFCIIPNKKKSQNEKEIFFNCSYKLNFDLKIIKLKYLRNFSLLLNFSNIFVINNEFNIWFCC